VVEGLQAGSFLVQRTAVVASGVIVKFTARDTSSSIERAQYSVDGGDWILVAPSGGISDAPEERYEFSLNGLSPGEHTIAVRAYDKFENVGSAKATVAVPAREM
jgi:hypothetical protein